MKFEDQPSEPARASEGREDPPPSRRGTGVACALASLAFTALLLPTTQGAPVGMIEDDGFFYAKIAYNLATGHGSTFDGLNVTSGYHLLWGFCLAALSKVAGLFTLDRVHHLALHLAFSVFIGLWAAATFFKHPLLRLAVFFVAIWSFALTEALLLSVIVLFVLHRFLEREEKVDPTPLDLVAIGLVPLARIDAGLIVGLLALSYLPRERRRFVKVSLAIAAGVAVHAVSMLAMFGHLFSVSSILKTGASKVLSLGQRLFINTFDSRAQTVKVIAIGVLVVIALVAWRRGLDQVRRRRWLVATGAVMSYFLALFFLGVMRSWYFTSTMIAMMYLVSAMPRRAGPAPNQPGRDLHELSLCGFSVILILIVSGIYIRSGSANELDRAHSMAFTHEVNRRVPATEPIFQIDGAGFTGYWLRPPVIDGDGLVNSYDYMRRLRADDLGGYLVERNICLIIRNTPPERARVVQYHGLEVGTDDVTTLIAPTSTGGNSLWRFRLFLLKAPRCQRLAHLATVAPTGE